jgi:hypothetical protein
MNGVKPTRNDSNLPRRGNVRKLSCAAAERVLVADGQGKHAAFVFAVHFTLFEFTNPNPSLT